MNVFETLFPPRSRAPRAGAGRPRGGRHSERRNRLASLAIAERLENRLALAITTGDIVRTSAPDFFIDTGFADDSRDMYCDYASFQITNTDDGDITPEPIDVWVKARNFSSPKVGLADDGIMHVGTVAEGSTGAAFFYLQSTAGQVLGLNETYDIDVYDTDPSLPGALPIATRTFTIDNVFETIQASTNKIFSVTYDNLTPVVGDDITMIVTGELGNGSQFASFTPATRLNWLPNTFELRHTSISIASPVPVVNAANRLYFTGLDGSGTSNQQPFTANYTFRITASTGGPVVPSPTQFTLDQNKWKHHGPEGTVIDVPPVKSRLSITKTPATETVEAGDPATHAFTITVTNNSSSYAATDVVVVDTWPVGLDIDSILKSQGTLVPPAPTGSFTWNVGSIAVNSSATLTVNYTVPANAEPTSGTKQYINTATVTSSNDPESPHTATAETIVTTRAVLEITKTDLPDPVTAGGTGYTYTITVKNTGPSDAQLVSVLDDLPAGFVTTGFSGPGTLPVVGADPFTWGVGTLIAGATAQLVVTYRVESGVVPNTYTNTATATSPTDPLPRTATCDTTVVSNAVLTIAKGPAIQGTNAGDGITYSYMITVTNTGISNARNVTVVDTWPKPAGSIQQGTITVTAGTTPIPEADGDFTWVIDSLPPGPATLMVTYTVPLTTTVGDYVNNVSMTSEGFPTPLTAFATTVVAPPIPTSDTPALIIGTDDACALPGIVRVIDPVTGGELVSFEPYPGYKGSVRVASGDVNGDGLSDIVVAPGRGRPGLVRVYNTAGQPLDGGIYDFYPFGTGWRSGVEVAVGNVDGSIGNEIVAATSTGKPLVNVFQIQTGIGVNPNAIRSFRPFPKPYAAGVMLTVGDYGTYTNGSWTGVPDGKAEIAVGTNAGVPAQVRIFDAQPVTPVLLRSFLPFGSKYRQGVTLSSARFSSAVIEDVFVGTGVGGKSQLKVFDGSGAQASGTNAFATFFSKPNAMLFTAALDLTGGNGKVDSIYGAQGRGGVKGLPSGIGRFTGTPPVTSLGSWKAPLRIAPILIGPPIP